MKRGLLFSISGLMIAGSALWIGNAANQNEYYQPRQESIETKSAEGYQNYLARLRKNPETGKVEEADILAARQELQRMGKTNSSLNLQWTEMGPDDMGGRTRAILFDRNDPNKMWAASVSGGIFYSPNKGRSWLVVDDAMDNLAVVSLAQASNGDIYAGTGEDMYYFASGAASGGILGEGIFKSTDGGQTFTQLASTDPSSNPGEGWESVGKIETDPTDANRVYAATNEGLRISDDGGATWANAGMGSNETRDLIVAPSGAVFAKVGSRIYKSTNGDPGTYTELTSISGDPNTIVRPSGDRMRIAVSPQDENYIYILETQAGDYKAMYKSTDGGATFTPVQTIAGALNPIDQAPFAVALAVDPKDKDRVLIGGLTLWEYSEDDGWQQIASRFDGATNLYVHVDIHEIEWNPHDSTEIWVGNDGGLFKSENDGLTWLEENKGYATIQFYQMDVSLTGDLLGGTQDNGTLLITPNSGLPKAAFRTNSILQPSGQAVDGDGGFTAFSKLDPEVRFKAMQYGRLGRSINSGDEYAYFYANRMIGRYNAFSFAFADFVTPFRLWEKLDDKNSWDSVFFSADTINLSIGFGNGNTRYTGQFTKPQASTKFIASTFRAVAGGMTLTSDASGNLSGDGTGTFDAVTGQFTLEWVNPTSLEIRTSVGTEYDPGAIITVESETGDLPITHTLTNGLASGDTAMIQDPVQAMFAVGLTSYNNASQPGNKGGGIWMTRNVLSDRTQTPEWWHIGALNDEEVPSIMEFSHDGDVLFVGTNSGRVYRFSNLTNARSEETADIDIDYLQNPPAPSQAVVQSQVILTTSRTITGIGIDRENPDRLIITAGGYGGAAAHVYYTEQATSPTLTSSGFVSKDGDLPNMPVYDAVFNYNDANGGQVILGTDLGVFSTNDITASSVSWTQESQGFPNVPTFDLLQTRTIRYDLKTNLDFEGAIYAATHGRGIFKTSTTADYVGVDNPTIEPKEEKVELEIYPNPVNDYVNLKLNLEAKSDLQITVRDMTGRMVRAMNYNGVDRGTESLRLNLSGLKNGNYIISLINGNDVKTAKMIVRH